MSEFNCNTNAPKVKAIMSQSQSKGKSFNKSHISFERIATGPASSSTNRLSPPENLAKKRCTWCNSSNPITVVLSDSDHPSLDRTSFCSNNCFLQFSESLNTKSIKIQNITAPQVQPPHCTLCKSIVVCQQVFDSTGGLLGSFCSAECLQKHKLILAKLNTCKPESSNQQQRVFAKVITPPVAGSAGPSRVNIFPKNKSEQQKSQARENSIKSQSVIDSSSHCKPPALIALHKNTETISTIPLISLDSSEESDDSQVATASSNGINNNNHLNYKLKQQQQQEKRQHKPLQNRTLPHSSFKMSDSEASKPFSNVTQFRASTSSASLENLSKLSTSSSSTTNVSSSSNNNNSSQKTKQPPTYHYETYSVFDWDSYLRETKGKPAPKHCFKQNLNNYPTNEFLNGMKLEARDPRNPSSTCIATVVALFGLRLQLRLDGSDNANDFFELVDSENIHPIGHCEKSGDMLQPPLGFRRNPSQWHVFLVNALKDADRAPESCFKKPPPTPKSNHFEVGMKLEAIDRKNPRLICPATIGKVEGDEVFITFDGWKGAFDYKCHYASRELFPVGWCESTGHPLQPPGHKVPTEHNKAKQMSMTSLTAAKMMVENLPDKNVRGSRSNSQGSNTAASKSKKSSSSFSSSSSSSTPTSSTSKCANSTNGLTKSNGDLGTKSGKNGKTSDTSSKKAPVKIKINVAVPSVASSNVPTSSKLTPSATSKSSSSFTPSLSNLKTVESSSNGKGDTSSTLTSVSPALALASSPSSSSTNNPNTTVCNVNASASLSSNKPAAKRSHNDLLEQHSPLAHSSVESSKHVKVDKEYTCDTYSSEQGPSQCQLTSPTKGKVLPSSLNNSHSGGKRSLDSPSTASSNLPLSNPEGWSVDQVIEYLLSIDPSLSIHADIFKSHEIDGRALLLLTSDMMMKFMGLKLGPALKICSIIDRLKLQNKRNLPNH